MPRLLIDAHLDLAWSAISYDRDLTEPIDSIRRRETHMTDKRCRGHATVNLEEMRKGGVAVCLATILVRSGPDFELPEKGFMRFDLDHGSQTNAWCWAQGQLAYYHLLEEQGHIRFIKKRNDLDQHWNQWQTAPDQAPLGIILSMEGADPIPTLGHVDTWYNNGLRAIGPCHYGASHYGQGTGGRGTLTDRGVELLKKMEQVGIALDVTHLSDPALFQALDLFSGPTWASHHNARALVPDERQLTDEMIKLLIERDAVIGAALDNWMLYPGYVRGQTPRENTHLADVADHIDHVCQLAGSTRHSAIGSDLDGGFGYEQSPNDLDTIADLQKLNNILSGRGYSEDDLNAIFHKNWLRIFREALPE
ncbi:MAG: dipeptidase [Planctomycetota bacterium]|jgi:membrane dipeptidase